MIIRPGRTPLATLALGASLAAALATSFALSGPALAHGDHTHGHATLSLSIEGKVLKGQFNFPLESLLGFDYPPRTAAQKQTFDALRTRLADIGAFVEPAAEAGCVATASEVSPDLSAPPAEADIPNILHSFAFDCARPEALQSIQFPAFRNHAGLKQLRVDLRSPGGRKTHTVRPRFAAITF